MNEDGKKTIKMGSEYLPDKRCIWGELSEELSPDLIKWACGDVWSHALEGFLSPIADDEVQKELSEIIMTLETMPLKNDPRWFELSALACAGQARASVGLVHGIAHVIEGLLKLRYPGEYFGHAQLCATYLWPVLNLDMQHTEKINKLFGSYGIHKSIVENTARQLFDSCVYDLTIPVLQENWRLVLRDPSSRTNCILVRSDYLSHFTNRRFL